MKEQHTWRAGFESHLAERVDAIEARLRRETQSQSRAREIVLSRTQRGFLLGRNVFSSPVLSSLTASRLSVSTVYEGFATALPGYCLLDIVDSNGVWAAGRAFLTQYASVTLTRLGLKYLTMQILGMSTPPLSFCESVNFAVVYTLACDTAQLLYHETAARNTGDTGLQWLHRQRQRSLLSWSNLLRHTCHVLPALALRACHVTSPVIGMFVHGMCVLADLYIDKGLFTDNTYQGITLRRSPRERTPLLIWQGPNRDQVEIPQPLLCPITLDLLIEPVALTTSCRAISKAALMHWISIHSTDPLSRAKVTFNDLVALPEMDALVAEFAARHRWRACPLVLRQ